ncbi:hypothetical protein G8E10_04915 [Rhizobiaceae bacterium CRRU44]|uniref:Uncharacterized protein n=1 Tax=Ferranicluibacter rubi TaxID=2715133 RepID=A0AA43ZDP1_9HYPH|nr:hypothetical protein [Ferranicluibacter rubi]NHT75098.1 hypothetical protein [Ferranicluibacter rubi]
MTTTGVSEIQGAIGLHEKLEVAASAPAFTEDSVMDKVMDSITRAQGDIEDKVVTTSATTHQDIAAKFAFLARLIGREEGMLFIELPLLTSAIRDLAEFRCNSEERSGYRRLAESGTPSE